MPPAVPDHRRRPVPPPSTPCRCPLPVKPGRRRRPLPCSTKKMKPWEKPVARILKHLGSYFFLKTPGSSIQFGKLDSVYRVPSGLFARKRKMAPEVKDCLVKNIRRRMTPQPLKIRADVEMKCFQFDGVLHIKESMKKVEAAGNDDCPVKIKLVAPLLYVLTTQTLDKEQGITILNNAIKACTEEIDHHKGKLMVKEAPRAVSERDDNLLAKHMAKL